MTTITVKRHLPGPDITPTVYPGSTIGRERLDRRYASIVLLISLAIVL